MIQDDDYKSPWKITNATVATSLKTVTYLSDSGEKPTARKEPIAGTQTNNRTNQRISPWQNSLSFRR